LPETEFDAVAVRVLQVAVIADGFTRITWHHEEYARGLGFVRHVVDLSTAVDGDAEMRKGTNDGLVSAAEGLGLAFEKDEDKGIGDFGAFQPLDLQAAAVLVGPGANDAHSCKSLIEAGRRIDIRDVKSEVGKSWTQLILRGCNRAAQAQRAASLAQTDILRMAPWNDANAIILPGLGGSMGGIFSFAGAPAAFIAQNDV